MPLADGSTMTCLALSLDHLTAPVSAHGSPTVSCCLCWRPHPCPDAVHSHSITTPPWFANFVVAHRLHYWIAEHSPDRLQFVRGLPVTGLHPLLNSNCPACKHRQGGRDVSPENFIYENSRTMRGGVTSCICKRFVRIAIAREFNAKVMGGVAGNRAVSMLSHNRGGP